MTINNDVKKYYYEWVANIAMPFSSNYSQLLMALNSIDFIPSMDRDINRAIDGRQFRYRFALNNHIQDGVIEYFVDNEPCSMLEMMVALCFRIEEQIMSESNKGDRTSTWFREMLISLDLIGLDDNNFNINYFNTRINDFNNRNYCPNGYGGLFTIHDNTKDMRNFEIWYQMNYYINEIDRELEHHNI